MTREFLHNGSLVDIVTNGSSNLSINKLEANSGQFALYGAKGFIKKIDFFQQEREYLAIIKDGAGFGRIGIYPPKSSVVGTMQYLIPKGKNVLEFVYYYLKTVNFEKYVKGATIPHIYFRDYQKEPVPIFSIERQKQIAKRLKLFDISKQEFEQEISYQQIQLKKLRQQILQEAIEGKLTAKWRQQNHYVEPASELLARIQAEKEQLIKDKKIKKQKPLPPISDEEKSFDLPDGWVWCRLGEISNYGDAKKLKPAEISSDTWVLDLEDIEKETSRLLVKVRFKNRKSRSIQSVFKKGYVLYGKLRPYLDKVLVADQGGVCTTEIMPIKTWIYPHYLRYALKTKIFIEYTNKVVSGMRMPRLKTDDARLAIIQLPPLPEQKAIVAKVEKLLVLCDQMETQITASQTHAKQLMQAVLKETFPPVAKSR